jgi:hypothetical protein
MKSKPDETKTQILFRMWHSPATNEEIAEALGVNVTKLALIAKQHKLTKRKHPRFFDNENPRPGDPSPEEILAGTAEVQADWSEDERLKRFQGKRRVAYIAPAYGYDGRTAAFTRLN